MITKHDSYFCEKYNTRNVTSILWSREGRDPFTAEVHKWACSSDEQADILKLLLSCLLKSYF